MDKWARLRYQPNVPLFEDGTRATMCSENVAHSLECAREGTVLLKNENNTLPLPKKSRIALFGIHSIDYIIGGGGSGSVITKRRENIFDALKKRFCIFEETKAFYEEQIELQKRQYAEYVSENGEEIPPGLLISAGKATVETAVPERLINNAADFCATAILIIGRFSREGYDISREEFDLSDTERAVLGSLKKKFKKVIVVLNIGGSVSAAWIKNDPSISAAILAWQGGMCGGEAIAEIICGDVNPSGKLADTFADSIDSYPGSKTFFDSGDYVEYNEDIFVGYRYFETFNKDAVCYPFGFGLSYTDFSVTPCLCSFSDGRISVTARVKNVGKVPGKEVVQLYYRAPSGVLGKPSAELAAFKKTRLLNPGEGELLALDFDAKQMASYDDTGKVKKGAYILEKGKYAFFLGNSIRNTEKLDNELEIKEDTIVFRTQNRIGPNVPLNRLCADGSHETIIPDKTAVKYRKKVFGNKCTVKQPSLEAAARGEMTADEIVAAMSDAELARLVTGTDVKGVADFGLGNQEKYKIPNVRTVDGPAGLRAIEGIDIFATAWPCASLMASTWNTELLYGFGMRAAREVKENNIGVWLAPGMNIHRNPLCGRNFEYFSEDPIVSGEMAAAVVKGVQSQGIAATVKHFVCNNKETNRMYSDSRVSERALREIYLKGFEIVLKKANPHAVMTSYNKLNGIYTSENPGLILGILRGEWNYSGLVMSDWWNKANQVCEIAAGNNIRMPHGDCGEVLSALKDGKITRLDLEYNAKYVLEFILKLD